MLKKRQQILKKKDMSQPLDIDLSMLMYTEECPLLQKSNKKDNLYHLNVNINNLELEYYQEMFLRVLSYFTNRFLGAITDSDPYEMSSDDYEASDKLRS